MLVNSSYIIICCSILFISLKLTYYIDSYVLLRSLIHSKQFTTLFPIKDLFWRKFILSFAIVLFPSLLLINPIFISKAHQYFMGFLKGSRRDKDYDGQSSSNPFTRGFLNRRRIRQTTNLSNDELQVVLKKGGNIGGLVNEGNTCFMNSVLQSLSSSNTLLEFFEHEDVSKKELNFTKALKTLLNDLNGRHLTKNHDYRTDTLLKTMTKSPNKNILLGYNQEDAQEFFQSLLSELELDYKRIHNLPLHSNNKAEAFYNKDLASDSIFGSDRLGDLGNVFVPAEQIDPNLEDASLKSFKYNLLTPLDGLTASRVGCLQCGENGGIRYSVFSGLSLNLPTDNYTALNLTDLLKEWTKPEIIEGVDCNRCALKHVLEYQINQAAELELKLKESDEQKQQSLKKLIQLLNVRIQEISKELEKPVIDDEVYKKLHTKNMVQKSSKSSQTLISRPPPLLSIHINRSVFDPVTYRVRKNNARVIFPLKLDLDRFVANTDQINTDARFPLSKKVFEDSDDEVINEEPQEEEEEKEEEEDDDEEEDEEEAVEFLSTDGPSNTGFNYEDSSEEDALSNASIYSKDNKCIVGSEDEYEVKESDTKQKTDLSEEESSEEEEEEEEPALPGPSSNNIRTQILKQDITGPLVYQLRSVIVHYGTHNYGHYIAFRKYRGVWWRTSDETVDIVDEDEVLSTPGVFMLFYELDTLSENLKKDNQEVEIAANIKDEEEKEDLESSVETNDQSNGQAFAIANL